MARKQISGLLGAHSLFESLEGRVLFAFGEADTGFGAAGRATVGFGNPSRTPTITQVLPVTGSKVVTAGTTGLARFTSAGAIDTSFGSSGGKITLSAAATFIAAAVDPTNNNIYVLVSASSGTGLFRYTANGKVDGTYGTGGSISVTASKTFTPQGLAVDSTGKVIVAGVFKTDNSDGRKVRVYKLKTDGTSDTGFGSGGSFEFNLGAGNFLTPIIWDAVAGVKVVTGDKIQIIGGSIDYVPASFDQDFIPEAFDKAVLAVARLTSGGALDGGYGTGGIARADYAIEENIQQLGITGTLPRVGAYSSRSDGSALVGGIADAAVVGEFESDGDVKYLAAAESSSQLDSPLGITTLSDGRAIVVTQPSDVSGRGFSFAAISEDGEYGNVLFTDDNDDSTTDIEETGGGGAAATSGDGKLFIGGYSGFNVNAYLLQKFDVGAEADARPDEFINARANDIAKDSRGGLHLAYYDAAATNLVYVHRFPNGQWEDPVVVDNGAFAGQFLSIDVNNLDNPGIAYFNGNAGDLKVAQFIGNNWVLETVDSKGSVGLYPSFQYADDNDPVVTYYNKTKGLLTFALKNDNVKWGYENVDSSGDNVGRSSVLLPSPKTNRYTVAYVNNTTGAVMWAGHAKGGIWTPKVAATTKGGADFLSMAYGFSFEPAIAYYDAFAADLKLTYFDSSQQKFIIKTLATSGAQGLYTATYFGDFFGNPFVFGYNRSQDKVTLFSQSFSSTPLAEDVVTQAGKFLSVDWDGRTTDLAVFDAGTGKILIRPGPSLS